MTGSEAVPPDDERLTRTVVGGVGLTAAGFVLTRLLTFAIYLVLARLAAPEVFGRFAAASILLGAASIFVESGMLSALIQRRDRLEEAADTAFAATMLGGVALTLAALAAAPLIGLVFGSREIRNVAAGLSGVLAIGAATVVPDALLQRRFSILRRVIVDPLGVAAFGLTSIVALHEGLGVWALVLGTYASEVVQVVAAWKASGFRPRRRGVSLEMWRELARYGRYVLAATSIDHVAVAANTVLLGRFVSAGALGQYRYATRLGLVTQDLFVTAGSYALFPAFARVSHDRERFDRGFVKALRWSSWAVVPTSLLLLPLGPPLVVFLLGARWHPAGEALAVLSVAAASASVGSVSAEGLKASARTDALPRLHGIQAVLTIAFMAALLPFGLIGVAVGYAAGTVAANAYALVRAADLLELGRANVLRAIWPAWAASMPMAAGLFALDRFVVHAAGHRVLPGLALLVLEAIAGLALYAAWLQVFAPEAGSGLKRLVCAISSRAR
ncbi:MAG TPA: oligosaccharide flippase family protein, partial [Gaiellaceae bacterium]